MASKQMEALKKASALAKAEAKAAGKTSRAGRAAAAAAKKHVSDEEIMQRALAAKPTDGMSAGELIVSSNENQQLIEKTGFKYIDVRDLTPNPNNEYVIDPESIELLADLIHETKNTTPIIAREVKISEQYPHGLEIIDGERRYRAHLLLGERYGEHWYMVPARVFELDAITDEETNLILHAENMGQRILTASEVAIGAAAIKHSIEQRRKANPAAYKGKKTLELLADHLGISARQAAIEANIGENLSPDGLEALNAGTITKKAADAIARLDDSDQAEILADIQEGKLDASKAESAAKAQNADRNGVRAPKKPKKDVDDALRAARRALKRAVTGVGEPDPDLVAELRGLLDKLG